MTRESEQLAKVIEQLTAGDPSFRGELLNLACDRLRRLTERLQSDFFDSQDAETSERIFEAAATRLYQTLHDLPIKDARHFYQVATVEIRRELIQLCQEWRPQRDDSSSQLSLDEIQQWSNFHASIDELPAGEREVFELIWYHELNREEVAVLMKMPIKEIRRLWRSARLSLHDMLPPDELSIA